MFASRTLWNDLLDAGLVDELHLMLGAAILGGDRGLLMALRNTVRRPARVCALRRPAGECSHSVCRWAAAWMSVACQPPHRPITYVQYVCVWSLMMARNDTLGVLREVGLPSGRISYRERGDGPPVVFVHGLLVNADLWRHVVPAVAEAGFRCLAPDWPLGSHTIPVPNADLRPPGVAELVARFLETLELRDVIVVANDTGGAITQLLMVDHPERIAGVVLTPSDSFERFLPPPFALLPAVSRLPGAVWLLVQLLRVRSLHRLPITFGWVSKRPIPSGVVDSYLEPSRRDAAIRADLARFIRGVDNRHTLRAGSQLSNFNRPVLLAWAAEDRLFPLRLAHRLAAALPQATLRLVDDSFTFIPEDQPAQLARLIVEFARGDAAA